jgi:phosphoglycolate phosphatase
MKYQLCIFDFDGTLADSFPWLNRVINQVLETHQLKPLSAEEISLLRGGDGQQVIQERSVPFWKIPVIARDLRRRMRADAQQIPTFTGAQTILSQLSKQGIKLAIVSSNALENVETVLGPQSCALIHSFECNVPINGKGRVLERVVRRLNLLPYQAVYIGDELRDLRAARQVGMPFGAVSWGYNTLDALRAAQPDEVFTSFEEILARVGA